MYKVYSFQAYINMRPLLSTAVKWVVFVWVFFFLLYNDNDMSDGYMIYRL